MMFELFMNGKCLCCRSAVTTLRPEIGTVMYEDHKQVREADEVTSSLVCNSIISFT
jgi:Fe-S cluster biogenesis protein NfuA